jgi:acylpyruvate hydrolase
VKILCVGRNYAKHAKEMGAKPAEQPIWFWKPDSAIITDGQPVVLPPDVGAVHYEVELAVRFGRHARRIQPQEAMRRLNAATVAVDVTARDLQAKAKSAGEPWAQAKGHDTFLPLGPWMPLPKDLQKIELRLSVNGKEKQHGLTKDMTWSVAELVSLASHWTTFHPDDVLLTGTPEGVGPIVEGDLMEAEAVGLAKIRNPVVAAPWSQTASPAK